LRWGWFPDRGAFTPASAWATRNSCWPPFGRAGLSRTLTWSIGCLLPCRYNIHHLPMLRPDYHLGGGPSRFPTRLSGATGRVAEPFGTTPLRARMAGSPLPSGGLDVTVGGANQPRCCTRQCVRFLGRVGGVWATEVAVHLGPGSRCKRPTTMSGSPASTIAPSIWASSVLPSTDDRPPCATLEVAAKVVTFTARPTCGKMSSTTWPPTGAGRNRRRGPRAAHRDHTFNTV